MINSHLSYLIIETSYCHDLTLCTPPPKRKNVWLRHCADAHVHEIHQIWKTFYSMPQIKKRKRKSPRDVNIPAVHALGVLNEKKNHVGNLLQTQIKGKIQHRG